MLRTLCSIASQVGYYGPNNLLALTIYLLLRYHGVNIYTGIVFGIVLIWAIISGFCVETLKKIIRQPRPNNKKYINITDKNHSKQYGMPSGHAQLVVHLSMFVFLHFNNIYINTIVIVQVILTCWQRWYFKMHTYEQLFAGCLLGALFGYALYTTVQCYNYFCFKKKKQTHRERQVDLTLNNFISSLPCYVGRGDRPFVLSK